MADVPQQPPEPPSMGRGRRSQTLTDSGIIIVGGVVLVVFLLIIGSLFVPFAFGVDHTRTMLHQLSDIAVARGLITFLVAVGTISIAIVLIAYVIVAEEKDEATFKDRFASGKEVLTALIGILGTIIGFYFGSAQQRSAVATSALTVTEMKLDPASPKVGGDVNFSAAITGGKAPYAYVIRFAPKSVATLEGTTQDGTVRGKFTVPKEYDASKALTIELVATDAADGVGRKDVTVNISP